MIFGEHESLLYVKLQIAMVTNVLRFVTEIRYEFLARFSVSVDNFSSIVAQHVERDSHVFGCHRVIAVLVVQMFGIRQVAFEHVSHGAVCGNGHHIKIGNFLFAEETKFPTGSGSDMAVP